MYCGYVADTVATTTQRTMGTSAPPRNETVTEKSSPSGLSRRRLLAGLAAVPIVTAATEQSLAQTVGPHWTPQQAQAALKDAKGTKLVLLGTAAGPVPGRSRENDFVT